MGYQDDFYIVDNIAGYTSTINRSPTVYFRKGNKTGHITQYRINGTNVEREVALHNQGYTGANTPNPRDDNKVVLYKYWPNIVVRGNR